MALSSAAAEGEADFAALSPGSRQTRIAAAPKSTAASAQGSESLPRRARRIARRLSQTAPANVQSPSATGQNSPGARSSSSGCGMPGSFCGAAVTEGSDGSPPLAVSCGTGVASFSAAIAASSALRRSASLRAGVVYSVYAIIRSQ